MPFNSHYTISLLFYIQLYRDAIQYSIVFKTNSPFLYSSSCLFHHIVQLVFCKITDFGLEFRASPSWAWAGSQRREKSNFGRSHIKSLVKLPILLLGFASSSCHNSRSGHIILVTPLEIKIELLAYFFFIQSSK